MSNNLYSVGQEYQVKVAQEQKNQADMQSDCVGYAPMVKLADQLGKQAQHQHQLGYDAERASVILQSHPEFEDLIWLIRSGLI